MSGLDAAVGEHAVYAEMTGIVRHIVDAAMAEMRQHIREIEARHRDFADAHFQESAECAVNALLALRRAEGGGGEVAALHDSAANEDFRVALANMVQTAGTFEIVVEHPHACEPLHLAHAIENFVDDFAEVVAILSGARGALESERGFLRLRCLQYFYRAGVSAPILQILDR